MVSFQGAWIDVYLSHDLEDVGGLEFSQFPFYLTVRTPSATRPSRCRSHNESAGASGSPENTNA